MIQGFVGCVMAGMTLSVSHFVGRCHNEAMQSVFTAQSARRMSGVAPVRISEAVMDETPEEWVRLLDAVASRGDVAAFEILFRHFGPRVKTYMLRQTKNLHMAEELMQETMVTVWRKAALYDPARGNVSAWIFTIARNLFISACRKQNRPEFDPNDPAFVPAATEPADVGLASRQDAETLHAALLDLPSEQRELVQRSFFGDVPHSTLAQEFGLPLGTVKSRIRMAIAKLRKSMEDRR